MEDVRVSIICNTYNHFPYITDCLEGFLKQKTNFSFEVLVHDDASTDGTDTIVREYAKRYRNIIKPIYQSVNQYSRGINISMQYQFPRVRGKYIALCEGDDYWTDPLKLQRQYDIMEKYPDIDICAHSVERISASTGKRIDFIEPYKQDKIILTEQVIMKEGGFVGTSSLFFRSRLNYDIPKFRKILPLDYTIQIHGALRGGMLYLCNPMSVYRWMTPGSWTSRQNNLKKINSFYQNKQQMLVQLNHDTNGKYKEIIALRMNKNEFYNLLANDQYKDAMSSKFKMCFKELPYSRQMKIHIKKNFPFIYKLERRIIGNKR